MFKKILFIILLLATAGAVYFFIIKKNQPSVSQVCFKMQCFNVEVAKTIMEKERGLMFRKSLADDAGMLFVYDIEGWRNIWMKNTLIPLDIIWLDKNKEVIFLVKDAPPDQNNNIARFEPDKKAQYVLEINAGWIDKLGLRVGDKMAF